MVHAGKNEMNHMNTGNNNDNNKGNGLQEAKMGNHF